jgi:hypothetical protein
MSFRDVKIALPPLTQDLDKVGKGDAGRQMSGTPMTTRLSNAGLQESIQLVKLETWQELAEWGAVSGQLIPWQVTISRTLYSKLQKGIRLKADECKGLLEVLDAARLKGFHG